MTTLEKLDNAIQLLREVKSELYEKAETVPEEDEEALNKFDSDYGTLSYVLGELDTIKL